MFKRALIGILLIATAGGLALLGARDLIAERALKRKLHRISTRIGEPIRFESATLVALDRVMVRGLQVGADRWLYIQRLEVKLERDGLLGKLISGARPEIQQVTLRQPTLLASGHHLKDSLRNQKSRVSRVLSRLRGLSSGRPSVQSSGSSEQSPTELIDKLFRRLRLAKGER